MGTIFAASSCGIPRVMARFGVASASMASTVKPLLAKNSAKTPAIRVLPTPPLPETAIFISEAL